MGFLGLAFGYGCGALLAWYLCGASISSLLDLTFIISRVMRPRGSCPASHRPLPI
jgi:hypothetical protein